MCRGRACTLHFRGITKVPPDTWLKSFKGYTQDMESTEEVSEDIRKNFIMQTASKTMVHAEPPKDLIARG